MWESFIDIWQYDFTWRAFLASTMVGLTCGVLGCFIVLRNMSLIGDALAHAILPGIVVAFIVVGGYSTMAFFLGAVGAALLTAVGITWIQHNIKTKNDAAIGIMFTAMFSLGVIGISYLSRGEGVHLDLKDFLFGNVLGVSDEDLIMTAMVSCYVLISIILLYRYLFATTFQATIARTLGISVQSMHYFLMLLLSFAVVSSLRTVGVILVVAMLITPASTALLWSQRLKKVLIISGFIGVLSAAIGMIVAILFETTPGPAMAVVATAFYFITSVIAPERGLIAKYNAKQSLKLRIELEDVLKEILKIDQSGTISLQQLDDRIYLTEKPLSRHLKRLAKTGLISFQNNTVSLSDTGRKRASSLIRAHRLWETFLVHELGLDAGQIHESAERQEHLLTTAQVDRVDDYLGNPETDPHGSRIPQKS